MQSWPPFPPNSPEPDGIKSHRGDLQACSAMHTGIKLDLVLQDFSEKACVAPWSKPQQRSFPSLAPSFIPDARKCCKDLCVSNVPIYKTKLN